MKSCNRCGYGGLRVSYQEWVLIDLSFTLWLKQ